ncbi:MAG TPA: molybdopterin-synthase adenylyltransferase MoeB [Fimbriimonadaceae bacterium]|nr:molybdopterin-synthase adenylyltransferase MoeB [Fimbriimonadaceae bacterium]
MENSNLTHEEILRYSRHLIMPEVGMEGQRRLKAASVLVVGAGGLGSPALMYLAAAGVGRLGIVDCDDVDFTNLQRQVIHGTPDVGRRKLQSAEETVKAINPNVEVVKHETVLSSENALEILGGYDVVIDGTDNFPTRFLVNDACVLLSKPNIYGSIFRFDGQATVFWPGRGPCYRCLFPEPPPPGTVPSCAEGGVLGVLPGVIGTIQATEAIKIILDRGETLVGRLLLYDALHMKFREIKIDRDAACPVCGESPAVTELIDYYEFCGVPGHGSNQVVFEDEISATELKALRESGGRFVLVDVREPHEYEINRIEGSVLIPLHDLASRMNELDTADEIVVMCLMGGRSAQACEFLRASGFGKVKNLRGGIRAWIDEVDPILPQY